MQSLLCAHFDKQREMGEGGFDLACGMKDGLHHHLRKF